MTRPPYDPEHLERHEESDPVAERLERYAQETASAPQGDLADRIMAAVAAAPRPRRNLTAWLSALLAGRAPGHRVARLGVVAAALVLVVGGALAASELVRLVGPPNVGSSPSAVESTATPTPSPTESAPELAPTTKPSTAPEDSSGPEASETPEAVSPSVQSVAPTASGSDGEDGHGGSETPDPTETPHPSGGGGDD